jgi:hypothetical protein
MPPVRTPLQFTPAQDHPHQLLLENTPLATAFLPFYSCQVLSKAQGLAYVSSFPFLSSRSLVRPSSRDLTTCAIFHNSATALAADPSGFEEGVSDVSTCRDFRPLRGDVDYRLSVIW